MIKQWKRQEILPPVEDRRNMVIDLQRMTKIFDSIVIDEDTDILMVETAPNEHLEMDKFRIMLPKALENQIIRRFHTDPQQGHFGVGITANRV